MKIIYPQKVDKIIGVPNWLLLNRISFALLKAFLISKHSLFAKIKYRQIKPLIKCAGKYKDLEIVNVKSQKGDNVKILL